MNLTSLSIPRFSKAKCHSPEIDPDFFFPESRLVMSERELKLAAICNSCIHKLDCLVFAVNNNETEGYWGGTTPHQRKHMMKPRKEEGSVRFREIQGYLKTGMTREEIADQLGIQVDSVDRIILRAKKKGITL